MRSLTMVSVLAASLLTPALAAADTATNKIEEGRAAYQKGDLPRALTQLQAALAEVRGKLAGQVTKLMPAAPAGWDALEPETEDLEAVGGGLSVNRAYQTQGGEGSMNVGVTLDNPSIAGTAALLTNPAAPQSPNVKKIKVGEQDVLLRWDPQAASGELLMAFGTRMLLQIEGDGLKSPDAMTELAARIDTKALRKVAGI